MRISDMQDDYEILKELGERIKAHRIALNMTQKQLADKSRVSMSTVIRIEDGDDPKLSNVVKLLRILNLIENLNAVIPEGRADYKILYEKKNARKRVRGKRSLNPTWKPSIGFKASWSWDENTEETE